MISKFLTVATVSALMVVGSVSIVAAQDAYEQRSEAMKSMGGMAKTIGEMLQGKTEFDAAAANAAIVNARDHMVDFRDYFPEGSDGGKSEAGPAIWTDPEGFTAAVLKVQGDLETAVGENPQTKEEVQVVFGTIAGNCKNCHETYRIQK